MRAQAQIFSIPGWVLVLFSILGLMPTREPNNRAQHTQTIYNRLFGILRTNFWYSPKQTLDECAYISSIYQNLRLFFILHVYSCICRDNAIN
ncbi:unnamed protein product [Prunus brigantina]